MRRIILDFVFIAILLVAVRVHGQVSEQGSAPRPSDIDTAAVVRECLETVRSNIGGWCGTPESEARGRLEKISKPAVPHLIESLRGNDLPEIDRFVAGVLSSVCCYLFPNEPHDALVAEAERWWKTNQGLTEQQWILDALRSGDRKRIQFALRRSGLIKDSQHISALVSLLESRNEHVEIAALHILWTNFQSQEVLRHIRRRCRDGTPEQKKMALGFCAGNKLKSLSPVIAQVLRTQTDYGVLSAALKAARETHAIECLAVIEEMDRGPSSRYPKNHVIRALAELKGKEYAGRVLYYLEKGTRGERMAAAEIIDSCVSPEKAVVPLLAALNDPNLNVRGYACASLGRVASNKSNQRKLGDIVPSLIGLFHHEDGSSLGWTVHKALWQICYSHFGHDAVPQVDGSLGGSRFAKHAQPIWEKWWEVHGQKNHLPE